MLRAPWGLIWVTFSLFFSAIFCNISYWSIINLVISEEVRLIYPEFTSLNIDGTMQGIKYSKLISVLIKSVQELKDEVDSLKSQIDG